MSPPSNNQQRYRRLVARTGLAHARRFRTPARIAKAPRRSDGRTLEFRCKHFSINNV